MTGDISAFLFDPRQAYTSVRLQQGRIITDLDWNENERIEADRRRRMLADLVCGHGSSNDGFGPIAATIGTVEAGGDDGTIGVQTYDVTLAAGTFLLAGELHSWPEADVESFLSQRDWLQLTGADRAALPSVPDAGRTDLVYLEAFEQPVTAVEDRELRERALGGPDTSTRMKAIRRVRILEDLPNDCRQAAAAMQASVTAPSTGDTSGVPHQFDPVTCEVRSKARLTVDFSGPGPTGDLCRPRVTQGYLGAENQAIRVQLTRADRFLWAYDNAAPLYRMQITDDTPAADGSIELTLLTPPNDPALFPLEDMVVEVLPWGALLANLEKTATESGPLARVTTAYDPGTGSLRIAPEVPGVLQSWLGSTERNSILSPRDPETERRFFYIRIWQSGPAENTDLEHSFQPGTDVELPGTGLVVNFSSFGLPGDFWIIAARPNTPDRVVPWRLLDATAPFGPKRFFAPLGLVDWQLSANGELSAEVADCRHRFRKLCDIESCCTVHVGDGNESTGDTTDLQAAIERLRARGGHGRICLLPGRHLAAAVIDGLTDVTIEGCGPRSVLIAGEGQTAPLITVGRSRRITLRDFATDSPTTRHLFAARVQDLAVERIEMLARDRGAILGTRMDGMRVERCTVDTLSPPRGQVGQGLPVEPAIFLAGNRLAVHRCVVQTEPGRNAQLTALGGLQIGGDSTDVEIAETLIQGGNGPGITLGSVDFQPRRVLNEASRLRDYYRARTAQPTYSSWLVATEDGCLELEPRPRTPGNDDDGQPLRPISDGPVVDCRIRKNRIVDMGASGITAAFWFDPEDEGDAIVTDRLLIAGNEIRRCMRLATTGLSIQFRQIAAFGGITLAVGSDIDIRDNRITELALAHPSPIVGIFALDATAIAIQRNHLRDNGRIATLESQIEVGLAGGIMLAMARPGIDFFDTVFLQSLRGARQDGAAACLIEDNTVVAREGRALTVIGVGPMMIHGNRLTAHGSNTVSRIPIAGATSANFNLTTLALIGLLSVRQIRNPLLALLDVLGGASVAVLNLGLSNEVYLQLLGFSGLGLVEPPQEAGTSFDDDLRLLANGNVMFNDNQVVLDSVSPAVTLTLSAILLLSLDDVAMEDNQCDCDMGLDFVGVNAVAIGWSVRMQGNRMKEGALNAFLSGLTAAVMNNTSNNQGTHCFTIAGGFRPQIVTTGLPAGATVEIETNRHLLPESFCQPFRRAEPQLESGFGIQRQQAAIFRPVG